MVTVVGNGQDYDVEYWMRRSLEFGRVTVQQLPRNAWSRGWNFFGGSPGLLLPADLANYGLAPIASTTSIYRVQRNDPADEWQRLMRSRCC